MNAEYQKAIDEVFRIADVRGNEFVRVLDAGSLTPDEFRRGALQMYHVVHFFPRFLAALIANIDDHKQRTNHHPSGDSQAAWVERKRSHPL